MLLIIIPVLVTYAIIRLLHLTSSTTVPIVRWKNEDSNFVRSIVNMCPILHKPYIPPLLWGKSGHVQTFMYAKMGRVNYPVPKGVRHTKVLKDGSTLTFDLYTPVQQNKSKEERVILLCPGIGNSSESIYIRTLVNYSQKHGYNCVVLNHVGALQDVPVTAPRMFAYGETSDLAEVRNEVDILFPNANLILVGISMGANIVVKYLGEDVSRQQGVLAAFSICQGYDIKECANLLMRWENLRCCYIRVMAANQLKILKQHKEQLLEEEFVKEAGIDAQEVYRAKMLNELDEAYTRRMIGYKSVEEFYHEQSSCHYITNIHIPMILLNAEDDPIVPKSLWKHPLRAAKSLDNCIFVSTKHGGHLGYFEGNWLRARSLTWMDRFVIECANAILTLHEEGKLPRGEERENSLLDKKSSENTGLGNDNQEPNMINFQGPIRKSNNIHLHEISANFL